MKLLEQKTEYRRDDASGGRIPHIALKLLAERYLKKRDIDCVFERSFCGYVPDVIARDASVVIECGDTQNPNKMLTYFRQGHIQEFLQIPYPDADDTDILAYRFLPKSELIEFLEFLEQEKLSTLRKQMTKRH
jgi:hypothetical protein